MIADNRYSIVNRFLDLQYMLLQIFNSVIIMNHISYFQPIRCAKAIFTDHQREMTKLIDISECNMEPDRIDLPFIKRIFWNQRICETPA